MRWTGLAILAVGCGSHPQITSDGGAVDGLSIDADLIDAPPATGVASVTLLNYSVPIAGVDVVFTDPSGVPVAHLVTDSAGKASNEITAGASVIAIQNFGTQHYLVTVLGVQPGDALVVGVEGAGSSETGQVTVHIPSFYAGASYYSVDDGCAEGDVPGAALSVNVDFDASCKHADGLFDAVGIAYNAASSPIAYARATELTPPPNNGVVAAMLGAWRTDFAQTELSVLHAPPNSTSLYASVLPLHDSARFQYQSQIVPIIAGNGDSVQLTYADGVANLISYQLAITLVEGSGTSKVSYDRVTAPTASAIVDLATDVLPGIHDFSVFSAVGQTSPRLSWVADGDLSTSDGAYAGYSWTNGDQWTQIVIMPPAITSPIQLPSLPPELAMHATPPGQAFTSTVLDFIKRDDITPAQFRAHWSDVIDEADVAQHIQLDSSSAP